MNPQASEAVDRITDFSAADGDSISLPFHFADYTASNQIAENVRLIVSGSQAQNGTSLSFYGSEIILENVGAYTLSSSSLTSYPNAGKILIGDETAGTVNDDSGNILTGTSDGDILIGYGGADTLNGGAGNDRIYVVGANYGAGEAGNDSIDGGADTDHVVLESAAGGNYNVDLITGVGTVGSSTFSIANVEWLTSGSGNDWVYGSAADNLLKGGDGDDLIYGTDGNDTLEGGSGNDSPQGGNGDDSVFGGNGNDYLEGNDGNDTLDGGTGDDFIVLGGGNNTVNGGSGFDLADFYFWLADDSAQGGVVASLLTNSANVSGTNGGVSTLNSIEALSGTEFNDTLTGDAGNNYDGCWRGDDSLRGRSGADTR